MKYFLEFIADFEIFSHFPNQCPPLNFLMPRSMLSKLKGPACYCLASKASIYDVFGL